MSKVMLALILCFLVLASSPALSEVVSTNDSMACPSIREITAFSKTFKTPPSCIEFGKGRKFQGPFETKKGQWFDEERDFYLIEVPGRGRMWTPVFWSKVVGSGFKDPSIPDSVATSSAWYARLLRDRFPKGVPLHGHTYPPAELPCHADITKFDIRPRARGDVFVVEGSLSLGPIRPPFKVFDGAKGKKYMLHLQGYLFSPSGRLVWSQQGFPAGGAWLSTGGGSVSFTLVDSLTGDHSGGELIVVAAGDPILSEVTESRVLLGAKRMVVP